MKGAEQGIVWQRGGNEHFLEDGEFMRVVAAQQVTPDELSGGAYAVTAVTKSHSCLFCSICTGLKATAQLLYSCGSSFTCYPATPFHQPDTFK